MHRFTMIYHQSIREAESATFHRASDGFISSLPIASDGVQLVAGNFKR